MRNRKMSKVLAILMIISMCWQLMPALAFAEGLSPDPDAAVATGEEFGSAEPTVKDDVYEENSSMGTFSQLLADEANNGDAGTVTTLNELIAAINSANGTADNPTVVNVGDITVNNIIFIYDKHVKLVGGSLTRADGFTSAFIMTSGTTTGTTTLVLENITLDGKNIPGALNALVYIGSGNGTFIMESGAKLINNSNCGVFLQSGTFNMNGGEISGNTTSDDGAGVYCYPGSTFIMNGGVIRNNTASGTSSMGGGVACFGTFIMKDGDIRENTSNGHAGGVYLSNNTTFTMSGGKISDNTAQQSAGGIYVSPGVTFTMSGGEISGNKAVSNFGGGILNYTTLILSDNPSIRGNTKGEGESQEANDIYLPNGKIIKLAGALTGSDKSIGVVSEHIPTESAPITIAQGDGTYVPTAGDAKKFYYNSADIKPALADGVIKLQYNSGDAEPGYTYESNVDGNDTITITSANLNDATEIDIPETIDGHTVTRIADNSEVNSVFFNKGLTSVTLPDTLTHIGRSAFENNNLSGIIIPASVESIGESAFAEQGDPDTKEKDSKFATVTFAEGSLLETIGEFAFADNVIEEVTIPASVTEIGGEAFALNNLKTVTIPASVTSLGDYAFGGNQLTDVTIENDELVFGEEVFIQNPEQLTIHGYSGSTAQTYATAKSHNFVPLDGGGEELSDAESVAADLAALDETAFTFKGSDNKDSVTQKFTLPLTGKNGTTISWTVTSGGDNASVNGATGEVTVTRPAHGNGNATIQLTATISKNDINDSKVLRVVVTEEPLALPVGSTVSFAGMDWIVISSSPYNKMILKGLVQENGSNKLMQYNSSRENTYTGSTIETYLNGAFLATLGAAANDIQAADWACGPENNPTSVIINKKIGLLTKDEFVSNKSKGANLDSNAKVNGNWWLMTPRTSPGYSAYVLTNENGQGFGNSALVTDSTKVVRPVINLKPSVNFYLSDGKYVVGTPSYTVTYNGNGNTGGSVPTDSGTYVQGATVTALGNTGSLTKTGYTFAGWNTQADGKGTNYSAGATFTMGDANVTLYANWTAAGGGNSGGNNGGSGGNSSTPAAASNHTDVTLNGANQGNAATTKTEEGTNGQTTTTVTLDQKKIDGILDKLADAGTGDTAQNQPIITIPVAGKAETVVGELNGQMVKDMEKKDVILEIKTETAAYSLPAQQIDISAVSQSIGQDVTLSDIKVQIEIAKPNDAAVKVIGDSANKGSFTLVVPPVEFKVSCTYEGKTVEVSQFKNYVERTVAIPDGIDPAKITTGVVVEPDGTVRHVPTKIIIIDGKYFAQINSLTNSTYSVIWHPLEFKDVTNHWAKESTNDMGSRLVISGVGNDMFEPDRDITRAEFAAIIVRALGLKPGTGSNPFADVSNTAWYCDSIKTAVEYKLISGYGNGKFGPNDKITREQAMTMVARAMGITGLKAEFANGEMDKLLTSFGDAAKASDYAKNSMAACVKTGIVSGRNGNLLAPKDNITRAEVAIIVQRLLQKSNLI